MQASIIIPTKNREEILMNSLEAAVKAIETIDAEIIVVNDGDKDILIPEEWHSRIKVILNPKQGVASARNLGARNAFSELLIFMDDDMLVNEAAVKKVIDLADMHPDGTININWEYPPGLVQEIRKNKFGRYLEHYGFTTLRGWNKGQPWDEHELFENPGLTSQFLAIRKTTFDSVNGYNETFPHAGFEDYDFSKRLKNMGVHLYVWPKDAIYHNEADRLDLRKWLERKQRGGETRKHAVLEGNKELVLYYKGFKKIILQCLALTENFWIGFLELLPNKKMLDGLYGKLVNILLATAIFKGYTKVKNGTP
jgi:GT2 family glycosyltransferase